MSGSNGNSIEIGQSDQELVGSKKRTNYKKIAIISLIFLVVVAIIVVVVVLVTGNNESENGNDHRPPPPTHAGFELDDYLGGRFSAARNNASWISDKELMYRDINDNIVKYNVETEQVTTIASAEIELIRETGEFELSADKKYLLVATKYERIFRHSAAAIYDVIDLETKEVIPIKVNGKQEHLLLAKWAPVGNGLVFVYNFNLFYLPSIGSEEIKITTDGNGVIRYGVTDWVYEEEVFSSKDAVWFSPNGKKLAYIKFDDTEVVLMSIPVYGIPGSLDYQYPKSFVLNYPKSGTPNPDVMLYTVDLEALRPGTKINVTEVPDTVKDRKASERIISAVAWQDNEWVMSVWMNRIQNIAEIQTCSFSSISTCKLIKNIVSTTGWVDLFKPPLVKKDGSEIMLIASMDQGSAGGYRHLVTIPTDQSNRIIALTSGLYVVLNILHWDQDKQIVFYTANTADDPNEQHVYAVQNKVGAKPQCLTCDIEINGKKQTFFSASFSLNGNHLMLVTDGPNIPKVDLYSWHENNDAISIKWNRNWESNPELHEFLEHKIAPDVTYHRIKLNSGYEATIRLQLPPNAITDGSVKYPLLVDVYGGPDSYAGTNRFSLDYGSYLSSNGSVIMAQINGRGCGLRGDKIMHEIYLKLGTVEIEDQIEAAHKLGQFPYIDEKRIGIWGWSYGGYASGMALAKDTNHTFKCAASVAPVTDWIYYDTIYTERYMDLPLNNPEGYKNGRLSTKYDEFRGKDYFLIHGTFDDNVHFQQSMALSRSLEVHDVLFTQMSYVDENHAMYSVRKHLYHSLGRFFSQCFELDRNL